MPGGGPPEVVILVATGEGVERVYPENIVTVLHPDARIRAVLVAEVVAGMGVDPSTVAAYVSRQVDAEAYKGFLAVKLFSPEGIEASKILVVDIGSVHEYAGKAIIAGIRAGAERLVIGAHPDVLHKLGELAGALGTMAPATLIG